MRTRRPHPSMSQEETRPWVNSYAMVRNIADSEKRLEMKKALDRMLQPYSGWRITLAGSAEYEGWEITGENPIDDLSWRVTITLPEHQTTAHLIAVVRNRIEACI